MSHQGRNASSASDLPNTCNFIKSNLYEHLGEDKVDQLVRPTSPATKFNLVDKAEPMSLLCAAKVIKRNGRRLS